MHGYASYNHKLETVSYADDTARGAATGFPIGSVSSLTKTFAPEDVGRICYVVSTGCYWRLTDDSPVTWVKIIDPAAIAGAGYSTVQDEGAALTARTTLNFTGAGVSAADNAGATRSDVSIPGIALLNNGAATTYRAIWNITNASSITDNPGAGRIDIVLPTGGGSGAGTGEPFITHAATGGLSAERVLTPYGAGMDTLDLSAAGEARVKLTALMQGVASMGAGTGIVEQTGAASFAKRALGVAAGTDILTRADGDSRYFRLSNNLSDGVAATMRANLGLGTAAVLNSGTGAGDLPTRTQADGLYAGIGLAYVTVGNTASLPSERALAGESGVLNVTDGGAGGAVTVGVVTGGLATAKLANNAVTNAKLAQMAALTIKANNTGGAANALDITVAQACAMLSDWQAQDIYNYNPGVATYTGAFTLTAGDRGKVIYVNAPVDCNITCPSTLGAKFSCTIYQVGSGEFTFVAGAGVTIRNADGYYKSAGPWAGVNLHYYSATDCIVDGRLQA